MITRQEAYLELSGKGSEFRADTNVLYDVNPVNGEITEITDYAEIDAEVIRLQATYDAQAYARSRATEYPSIQEQLDLQYWDKVNSTDKWGEAVKAVKDKYPKG